MSDNDLLRTAREYRFYAQKISNAHYAMAEAAKTRHKQTGIVVTIATTVVGTAIFASLSQPTHSLWIQIPAGLLSLGAAVLSALQTFLNYDEVAARHKSGAVAYEAAQHRLDIFLLAHQQTADARARDAALKELADIGTSLHDISARSPTIPDGVYDAAYPKKADITPPLRESDG